MSTNFTSFILFVSVLAAYVSTQAVASPAQSRLENNIQQMNWKRIQGPTSTYIVSSVPATWGDARQYCFSGGYDQLAIETVQEWQFLLDNVFDSNGPAQYYWTSAAYFSGEWIWPNGSPIPVGNSSWVGWHFNEPASPGFGTLKRSVAAHYHGNSEGDWTTILDSSETPYICETAGSAPDQPEPCFKTNDLVIALDASGSVGEANFEYLKDFTARLVAAFNIHEDSRISVTKFASIVTSVLRLPHELSPEEVETVLREMPYGSGGGTNTGSAIQNAISQFNLDGREGVPQTLLVVTDGVSDFLYDTVIQANLARAAGINTFVVGISEETEELELLAIAGHSSRMFRIEQFDQLEQVLRRISRGMCATIA